MIRLLLIVAFAATAGAQPFTLNDPALSAARLRSASSGAAVETELISQAVYNLSAQVPPASWKGQSFSVAVPTQVTKIQIYGYDNNTNVGSFVVSLYADSGGKPGTEIAGTAVTNAASATAKSLGWVSWTLPAPLSMAAGATNHLVLRSIDSGNFMLYYHDGDIYAGGSYSYSGNSGGTWTLYAADMGFKVFGTQ